jgi:hypothetical protein
MDPTHPPTYLPTYIPTYLPTNQPWNREFQGIHNLFDIKRIAFFNIISFPFAPSLEGSVHPQALMATTTRRATHSEEKKRGLAGHCFRVLKAEQN